MEGETKKTEDVNAKLGTRFAMKEISEQTYNNLKNKYMIKVFELKSKVSNLESEALMLQKICSII